MTPSEEFPSLSPSEEETREALQEWQKHAWFVPDHFAREMVISGYEPSYRVTAEVTLERRAWKETNGEPPPDAWAVRPPPGADEHRLPGSERKLPCAECGAAGRRSCPPCAGLGRVRCTACTGAGCPVCGRAGVAPCVPCDGKGKTECPACGGVGACRRAHVLEIRRQVLRRQKSIRPVHPSLGARAPEPDRTLLELRTRGREETKRSLERRIPPELRRLVLELLEGLRPEEGSREVEERVVLEQIPLWKAAWTLGKRRGVLWLHGRPLRARLSYPPRSPILFAVTAWTALLVAALAGAAGFFLFTGRTQPPAEASIPPAAVLRVPEPAAPKPPSPAAEALSPDGIVLLTEGGLLRGTLRREGTSLVAPGPQGPVELQPWQIETVEPRAAEFIRLHVEQLTRLESSIAATLAAPGPSRESLVAQLLELHRLRDRWVRLQPLCREDERPAGPSPLDRIDHVKGRLETALETRPAPAAGPAAPLPNVPPAAAPGPPAELILALERFPKTTDPVGRGALAATLKPYLSAADLPRDLITVAWLLLSRDDREWGLRTDRVEFESTTIGATYEGTLELSTPTGVVLRGATGERIIATRGGDGTWSVRVPGGIAFTATGCTPTRSRPTRAGAILSEHLERFPPGQWLSGGPEEHVAQARILADLRDKEKTPHERGLNAVRMTAAALASSSMRSGSGPTIAAARDVLQRMGYVSSPAGTWQTPDDATAVAMADLLRAGMTADAFALVSKPQGTHEFAWWYRALAGRLLFPMASREEIAEAMKLLDRTAGRSTSETRLRHLQALKDSFSLFKVCAQCGGDATSTCSACRGTGSVRTLCGRCRGHGVVILAGQGGGTTLCPACKGIAEPPGRPCSRCTGRGRIDCTACRGPFRMPSPRELCGLIPCPLCLGSGRAGERIVTPCAGCEGLGKLLVPSGNPEAVLR